MENLTTRKVEIRPVRTEDLRFVYELEEQSFKDPFPNYFIDQLADANPETFLVAVYSGAIVGYAVVDDWSDHKHVVSIAVRAGFRRRGIAQALLDDLFERSRPGPLRLELRRSNHEALQLYMKNDFRETGIAHSYYTDGEDAIRMEKLIEKKPEILAPA
jgi:ribosomal-protein-alanine N-acetyltransferase